LARRLGIALSPHPHRTKYYELLTDEVKESFRCGTPERIIAFFEENALLSAVAESADLVSVNLEIPAVAELVFNYAKRTGTNLVTATLDTRHSRNAQKFREWCAIFSSLDDGGRASAKEQAEMLKELKNVCEVWKSDVREEVKYKNSKTESGKTTGGRRRIKILEYAREDDKRSDIVAKQQVFLLSILERSYQESQLTKPDQISRS